MPTTKSAVTAIATIRAPVEASIEYQRATDRARVPDLSCIMLQVDDTSGISRRTTDHRGLATLAASQDGLFTAKQATAFGVTRRLLSHHAKSGRYERLGRGLYLVPEIPGSPFREVVAAWLQAGGEDAVVSHETALVLHDLSDVIADHIHITLPRSRRSRKHPRGTVVHTRLEPLGEGEVQHRHFVRVTAPAVTILDCLEAGTGLEQIELAISQAVERGWTSSGDLMERASRRSRRLAGLLDRLLEHEADEA